MTKRWLVVVAILTASTLAVAAPRRTHVKSPGFEMTNDGGSRVFVSLTTKVTVEERRAEGTITYVLKGTRVRVGNNTRPLVTEHFNTPVLRVRLVPRGADLHLVVDLRAASAPTWKLIDRADGGADLQVDFPQGTFVTAEAASAPPVRRFEDPEAAPAMWRDAAATPEPNEAREDSATTEPGSRRASRRQTSGPRDDSRVTQDQRDALEAKRKELEQDRPKATLKRHEYKPPTAEQTARDKARRDQAEAAEAYKRKKRAENDEKRRTMMQEVDRQGGAGTAVTHD